MASRKATPPAGEPRTDALAVRRLDVPAAADPAGRRLLVPAALALTVLVAAGLALLRLTLRLQEASA